MTSQCQVNQTAGGRERRVNVRVPRSLYCELRQAADAYGVPGGVSEVARRGLRWASRYSVGRAAEHKCPTAVAREPSTVLTVFLPEALHRELLGSAGNDLAAALRAYLALPRPPPPRRFEPELAEGRDYVVTGLVEEEECGC